MLCMGGGITFLEKGSVIRSVIIASWKHTHYKTIFNETYTYCDNLRNKSSIIWEIHNLVIGPFFNKTYFRHHNWLKNIPFKGLVSAIKGPIFQIKDIFPCLSSVPFLYGSMPLWIHETFMFNLILRHTMIQTCDRQIRRMMISIWCCNLSPPPPVVVGVASYDKCLHAMAATNWCIECVCVGGGEVLVWFLIFGRGMFNTFWLKNHLECLVLP